MIQAYMDETGIHEGAPVCAICGYFGGPGQWKKLGSRWASIIKRYGVPEFHAYEFWAFTPKAERVGPYKGWSKSKADNFLEELVSTIEEYKVHAVSSCVVLESFNKLSHNQRRFLTGAEIVNGKFKGTGCPSKPYYLPFQCCITDTADYAPIGGKAHFFFDLNKQFKGYALDVYALLKKQDIKVKDRLGNIEFRPSLDIPQLQAADLLCYQTYQYALKRLANPAEKTNPLLQRLLKDIMVETNAFYDDYGLSLLLSDADIPPDI